MSTEMMTCPKHVPSLRIEARIYGVRVKAEKMRIQTATPFTRP